MGIGLAHRIEWLSTSTMKNVSLPRHVGGSTVSQFVDTVIGGGVWRCKGSLDFDLADVNDVLCHLCREIGEGAPTRTCSCPGAIAPSADEKNGAQEVVLVVEVMILRHWSSGWHVGQVNLGYLSRSWGSWNQIL